MSSLNNNKIGWHYMHETLIINPPSKNLRSAPVNNHSLLLIFFLSLALFYADEITYFYLFPTPPLIHNHIIIYSTCLWIFSNNFLYICFLTYPFLDFFLILFHLCLLHCSLDIFKPFQSIHSHFPEYVGNS